MGVRPRYLGQTDKVVGVEPIPLAELGRPRIDAVLRISGLFRGHLPPTWWELGGAGRCWPWPAWMSPRSRTLSKSTPTRSGSGWWPRA